MEKKQLDKLNSELKSIKEIIGDYNEKLSIKEKELEKKSSEIEDLEAKIKATKLKVSPSKNQRKKKYIQTSLFKPSSVNKQISYVQLKEIFSSLKRIEMDSMTPEDIREQVVELRQKLDRLI